MEEEHEVIKIELTEGWFDGRKFEQCLNSVLITEQDTIEIIIPAGCKIMLDAAIRLLSYANQLNFKDVQICLNFLDIEDNTYGYLDRIGFFDHLHGNIEVLPERPFISRAKIYHGENPGVFEIVSIDPEKKDNNLPSILTDRLLNNISFLDEKSAFEQASFTVFSELIDNIFLHSKTKLNGFLAFQVYQGSQSVKVAVSDSGKGIIQTLRPSIAIHYPEYNNLDDVEIIHKIFSEGLSKDGKENGCGLKSCAFHALKFSAQLDLRLPHAHFHLTPIGREFGKASINKSNVEILGTHISFDFRLDNI